MLDFTRGDSDAEDAAHRVRPVVEAFAEERQTPGYVRVGRPEQPAPKVSRFGRLGGVLLLTARDLQFRATRFGSAILGTAVVFTMLFLMRGLNEQFHREPRLVVDALGSDHWMLRAGTSGPFTSGESIPTAVLDRVRGADGAPVAVSRISVTDGLEPDALRLDAVLVGFVPDEPGTPTLTSGRLPEARGEVVLDEAADIPVGGEVGVGSQAYTVVGTTKETTLFAGMPLVYLPLETVQQMLFQGRSLASTFLLDGQPTRLPPGFIVLDGDAIAEDTMRPLENAVGSVNMIRILLWFVAAMIIGTLSYLSALDRSRDVAVLKAVGGGTAQLGASIALQGVLVALTAVAAASAFQYLLVPHFPLNVYVPNGAFLQLPLIAVVVALLSGAVGLRRAVRTDPALAFSGPGQ